MLIALLYTIISVLTKGYVDILRIILMILVSLVKTKKLLLSSLMFFNICFNRGF